MPEQDPLVERVRRARREIFEECGQDAHRLFEWAKSIERQHPERVKGYEQQRAGKAQKSA